MAISGIFGLPGSGKSTLLVAIAQKALDNKPLKFGGPFSNVNFGGNGFQRVYSNFYIKGCYKLNFEDLGKKNFHDCLILIDEISLFCDSRNYKNFGDDLKYFFALSRHYNVSICWASQSYMDCDVKIRRITPRYFFVEKFVGEYSKITPIQQFLNLDKFSISEGYQDEKLIHCAFLKRSKYYDNFDSFETKPLPEVDASLW